MIDYLWLTLDSGDITALILLDISCFLLLILWSTRIFGLGSNVGLDIRTFSVSDGQFFKSSAPVFCVFLGPGHQMRVFVPSQTVWKCQPVTTVNCVTVDQCVYDTFLCDTVVHQLIITSSVKMSSANLQTKLFSAACIHNLILSVTNQSQHHHEVKQINKLVLVCLL